MYFHFYHLAYSYHPLFIHSSHMLQLLHCFLLNVQDQNRVFCVIPQFLIISDSKCPLCQYWSIHIENVPVPFINVSSSLLIMNHGPHLYIRVFCNFVLYILLLLTVLDLHTDCKSSCQLPLADRILIPSCV